MKWLKRIWKSVTATALVAVIMISIVNIISLPEHEAAAAHNVNYLRILDFDNSISNNISSFKGGFAGAEFPRQGQEGAGELHLDVAEGVFGKDEDDKVMHLYNNPDVAYTLEDPYVFLNVGDTSDTQMLLTKGAWEKLSFEIAYDGEPGTKRIDTMYNGDWVGNDWKNTYGGKNAASLFKVMPDGRIAVFNEILQSNSFTAMAKGEWYDIDLLFYAGDSTAEAESEQNYYTLYVNNIEVETRTFVPTTANNGPIDVFPGFAGFWIGEDIYEVGHANETGIYGQKSLYIDNFSLLTVQNDSKPPIYTEWIKNDMDYTEATVPANGTLYGATVDYTRQKTSYVYETGVGGKGPEEYAWLMKTIDFDGVTTEETNPFFQWTRTGNNPAAGQLNHSAWQNCINWEGSVLLKDFNNLGARVEFVIVPRSGNWISAFVIFPDGNIMSNGKVVGNCTQNQWLRLGVSMSQTDKLIHVYLNGKRVNVISVPNIGCVDRFKVQTVFPSAMETQHWNATAAYDNIIVYSGEYITSSTMNKVKAGVKAGYTDRIHVNNTTNKISFKGIETIEDMHEALDIPNGQQIAFFTDHTYSTEAQTLDSGAVAVLTDGTLYRYYTVEEGETGGYILNNFETKMNGVSSDATFTVGTLTAEAKLTMYENIPICLLLAQYDQDKLVSCAAAEVLVPDSGIDVFDGTQVDVCASMQIAKEEGTQVKAFLWEKSSLTPICSPIVLTPMTKGEITSVIERYPNYANKAVMFSFDDGRAEDAQLIELFNQYGVRGTFNLNSNLQLLSQESDEQKAYVRELYKNQEVANHVRNHPHLGASDKPANVSVSTADEYIELINRGISELQAITGQSIEGMAWPYTNPTLMSNSNASEAAKIDAYVKNNEHIKYSRIADVTGSFDLPDTFKDWSFTCHYLSVPSLQEEFLAIPDSETSLKQFSIWGHSYEFADNSDNWYVIEDLLKAVTARNIWVPTNLEFVNYVNALRKLEKGTNYVVNHSDTDVYLLINYKPVKIAAGSAYTLYVDEEKHYPTIYLAGDSTCEITEEGLYPRNGWGMWLGSYLSANIVVSNQAKASRSTKTFIDEGRLDEILASIKNGDYLFIQFGHNDSMTGTDRATTVDEYKENLRIFVNSALDKGANPVLLTPIRLCIFDEENRVRDDSIDKYRNAMIDVAKELNVPLIDIGAVERAYMDEIGESESQKLYMVSGMAEGYTGTTDTTHLCVEGRSARL